MESTNVEKFKAGINTFNELLKLVKTLITEECNCVSLDKNVKYGEEGKDNDQFTVKVQIYFTNESMKWLIDFSSSFRSDRIKGKEFDIEHIKQILNKEKIGSKAFLLLPDNAKDNDKKELKNFKSHIEKQDKVTYFDYAMTMGDFRHCLEKKLTNNTKQGKKANIQGGFGEKDLYYAFNDSNNLKLWNDHENKITQSSTYELFKSVLNQIDPCIGKIKSCKAYGSNKDSKDKISQDLRCVRDKDNKIHGKPKTDVLIELVDCAEKRHVFRISVKKPAQNKGKVTVHEGVVEQLLNDLESTMPEKSKFKDKNYFNKLSKALNDFQVSGSKSKMDKKNLNFLNEYLSELNKWLIDYFVFGINNSLLNKNQQANFLLIYDSTNAKCKVNNIEEEEELLLDKKGTFNTPFSWTYPSKKRGKKIQIKSPVNKIFI